MGTILSSGKGKTHVWISTSTRKDKFLYRGTQQENQDGTEAQQQQGDCQEEECYEKHHYFSETSLPAQKTTCEKGGASETETITSRGCGSNLSSFAASQKCQVSSQATISSARAQAKDSKDGE
jgi:hypothetical protein